MSFPSRFSRISLLLLPLLLAGALEAGSRDLRRQALFELFQGRSPVLPRMQVDRQALPIFEYYPLDVGRQWTYRDEKAADQSPYTMKVDAKLMVQGVPVARMRRMDKEKEFELTRYSGSLQLVQSSDDYHGLYDWSSHPVPFSQGPTVKIGDRFEATPTSFVNPLTGGHVRWIVTHKRLRDVTVPAGTFPQCLQMEIRTVDTKTGAELTKFSMYLAPGVGLVKRQGRFLTHYFKQVLTSL